MEATSVQRQGSSPGMRGAREQDSRPAPSSGIIPAYAGSTLGCPKDSCIRRDHPRVCGEHVTVALDKVACFGSSPRMRGALDLAHLRHVWLGIIPAYAGSTPPSAQSCCTGRDHPRVCGEHAMHGARPSQSLGSSPRMRGARAVVEFRNLPVGIIPAYAGSTAWRCQAELRRWDHPRVCGEHVP